jgi:non-canonical poly(A) RNA polymerase PAPD5/7
LDLEVVDFKNYMTPTDEEIKCRERVARTINALVTQKSQGFYETEVYGSLASGYSLASADLDIRVYPPSTRDQVSAPNIATTRRLKGFLFSLIHPLKKVGFIDSSFVFSRFPLLDTQHAASQIIVQIVSANSSRLSAEYIKAQINRDPDILPIYAVVRIMLQLRNLHDVFRGGLGSYSVIMMIIASTKLLPGASVGEKLINFFDFYTTLDTTKHSVGLVPPGLHPKYPSQSQIPAIPQNPSVEQTVSCFCFLPIYIAIVSYLLTFSFCQTVLALQTSSILRKTGTRLYARPARPCGQDQ